MSVTYTVSPDVEFVKKIYTTIYFVIATSLKIVTREKASFDMSSALDNDLKNKR